MSRSHAEELKAQGNICFQASDFIGAEKFYTRAIIHDATNPAYFTNRALSRLKLSLWEAVIDDCHHALDLLPTSLKAYTYLGQAQLALDRPNEALSSSQQAYKLAIAVRSPSAATIAGTVLQAKKRKWEVAEEKRIVEEEGVLGKLVKLLTEEGEKEVSAVERQWSLGTMEGRADKGHRREEGGEWKDREGNEEGDRQALEDAVWEEIEARRHSTREKINLIKDVFARADPAKYKPRIVPDYLIDNITFCIMHDPVITKHGQSYERATILEHLRRSKTDPLTREPLTEEDLRPNLALRAACEEFMQGNGWAVDY
ncbi:hypothetical protein EV426DRAFT_241387 [Tirmania nivea]|nr:hypothetical protein EV426DRAFT_241387 [Tirmania nivea]